MEIRSDMVRSCASGRGGNKGEDRGRGLLDEAGVQAVVSTKRRKEVRGKRRGSSMGTKAWGLRADRMLGKSKSAQCIVHKDRECGKMTRPREKGELRT